MSATASSGMLRNTSIIYAVLLSWQGITQDRGFIVKNNAWAWKGIVRGTLTTFFMLVARTKPTSS